MDVTGLPSPQVSFSEGRARRVRYACATRALLIHTARRHGNKSTLLSDEIRTRGARVTLVLVVLLLVRDIIVAGDRAESLASERHKYTRRPAMNYKLAAYKMNC